METHLQYQQVSEEIPNWIGTNAERNLLDDESQLLQLGFSEETEFFEYKVTPN